MGQTFDASTWRYVHSWYARQACDLPALCSRSGRLLDPQDIMQSPNTRFSQHPFQLFGLTDPHARLALSPMLRRGLFPRCRMSSSLYFFFLIEAWLVTTPV